MSSTLCESLNGALQTISDAVKGYDLLATASQKREALLKDKETADSYVHYRPNSDRDVTDIPLAEITNVVIEAVRKQFSIDMDSLSLIAAKKLGFARRGTKVDKALNIAIEQAIQKGIIQNSDGKLHLL